MTDTDRIDFEIDPDDEFGGDYEEPGALRPEDVTGTVVYTLDWTVKTVIDQIDADPSDHVFGIAIREPAVVGFVDLVEQRDDVRVTPLHRQSRHLMRQSHAVDQHDRVTILVDLLLHLGGEETGGDVDTDPASAKTRNGPRYVDTSGRLRWRLTLSLSKHNDGRRPEAMSEIDTADEVDSPIAHASGDPSATVRSAGSSDHPLGDDLRERFKSVFLVLVVRVHLLEGALLPRASGRSLSRRRRGQESGHTTPHPRQCDRSIRNPVLPCRRSKRQGGLVVDAVTP